MLEDTNSLDAAHMNMQNHLNTKATQNQLLQFELRRYGGVVDILAAKTMVVGQIALFDSEIRNIY